jgi:hypothetical protein
MLAIGKLLFPKIFIYHSPKDEKYKLVNSTITENKIL